MIANTMFYLLWSIVHSTIIDGSSNGLALGKGQGQHYHLCEHVAVTTFFPAIEPTHKPFLKTDYLRCHNISFPELYGSMSQNMTTSCQPSSKPTITKWILSGTAKLNLLMMSSNTSIMSQIGCSSHAPPSLNRTRLMLVYMSKWCSIYF